MNETQLYNRIFDATNNIIGYGNIKKLASKHNIDLSRIRKELLDEYDELYRIADSSGKEMQNLKCAAILHLLN